MRVTTQAAISRNKSDMSIVFTGKTKLHTRKQFKQIKQERWVLNQSRCRRIQLIIQVCMFMTLHSAARAFSRPGRLDASGDGLTVLSWNDGVPCVVVHQLYTRAQLELELRLGALGQCPGLLHQI